MPLQPRRLMIAPAAVRCKRTLCRIGTSIVTEKPPYSVRTTELLARSCGLTAAGYFFSVGVQCISSVIGDAVASVTDWLIATSRPSVVSVARYTCPIPPSPIGAVMS